MQRFYTSANVTLEPFILLL